MYRNWRSKWSPGIWANLSTVWGTLWTAWLSLQGYRLLQDLQEVKQDHRRSQESKEKAGDHSEEKKILEEEDHPALYVK